MRDYIYGLVNRVPSLFRPAVRFVADVIFSIYDDAYKAMSLVAGAWPALRNGITWFANAVYYTLEAAYNALRWLITVKIPHVLDDLGTGLIRLFNQAIEYAVNGLHALMSAVQTVLQNGINLLTDWAHKAVDFIVNTVNKVIDTLNKVAKRVWDLLTDPDKFTEWVFGSIWRAFWKYLLNNVERYAAAAWRQRTRIGLTGLSIVESILARIL